MQPKAANSEAVVQSLVRVGPVMVLAGGIAAAGFFSVDLQYSDYSFIRYFYWNRDHQYADH